MTACQDPECARIRAELREALLRAEADIADRKARTALGGPPPPVDTTWANRLIPGALRPEYAHMAEDTGRSSKERTTP